MFLSKKCCVSYFVLGLTAQLLGRSEMMNGYLLRLSRCLRNDGLYSVMTVQESVSPCASIHICVETCSSKRVKCSIKAQYHIIASMWLSMYVRS